MPAGLRIVQLHSCPSSLRHIAVYRIRAPLRILKLQGRQTRGYTDPCGGLRWRKGVRCFLAHTFVYPHFNKEYVHSNLRHRCRARRNVGGAIAIRFAGMVSTKPVNDFAPSTSARTSPLSLNRSDDPYDCENDDYTARLAMCVYSTNWLVLCTRSFLMWWRNQLHF